jgi:RNA recognition motif-containing protein
MSLTKLFIGNLSFKTKESELADEFGAFGKVATANIITRGNRSLGYGFVEFENDQEAQSALQALNKKSINGREINVELATPRQEGAPRSPQQRRGGFRGGFRGGRGGRGGGSPQVRGDASPTQENNQELRDGDYSQSPRGGFRGGRGGRGRGGRGGRGGVRRPYNSNNNNNAPRSPNPNRIESPNSLFVANLPYSYSDDELKSLLPKATRATVAKNYQGKSKGFGFIEFANDEDRQAAFSLANGLKALDRELIVKIALVNDRSEAPASPAPAPTDA